MIEVHFTDDMTALDIAFDALEALDQIEGMIEDCLRNGYRALDADRLKLSPKPKRMRKRIERGYNELEWVTDELAIARAAIGAILERTL